jgi:hypothetical protein
MTWRIRVVSLSHEDVIAWYMRYPCEAGDVQDEPPATPQQAAAAGAAALASARALLVAQVRPLPWCCFAFRRPPPPATTTTTMTREVWASIVRLFVLRRADEGTA